jgi:DNA polymerase I
VDRILILDTYFLLWRSQVAFKSKPDELKKTVDTRYVAVYNFFRSLRLLIEQFQPQKCFLALEGNPQFRRDAYPGYKANRLVKIASKTQKEVDRFRLSKNEALNSVQHLPITRVRHDASEADDVVLTLVENLQGEDLTIVSSDGDYLQILQRGHKVKIYDPIKKKFLEPPPYNYVAWKSLRGDPADNIKGLPGISDKRAVELVNDPGKFAEFLSIEENRALFSINKNLIELRSIPLDELQIEEGITNFRKLREVFTKMQFASMVKKEYWEKFCNTFSCLKY